MYLSQNRLPDVSLRTPASYTIPSLVNTANTALEHNISTKYFIFSGIDEKGPQLFHMDPSGTFVEYDAKAIGSGSEGAQQSLKVNYRFEIIVKYLNWGTGIKPENVKVIDWDVNKVS